MQEYEGSTYTPDSEQSNCPSCGGQLIYSAENKKITCNYCGYKEDIDDANDEVVEQCLDEALTTVKSYIPEESGKKVFDCGNCGAKFMHDKEQVKVSCGFCGSTNVNVEAFQHQYIQPQGIIPFYISRVEAERQFNRWIKQGFFHPSKLKKLAEVEGLHGIYLPFWTYDAHTDASWSGDAGRFVHHNTARMGRGGMPRVPGMPNMPQMGRGMSRGGSVPQISWQHRSGKMRHFFDDILVIASGGLKQVEINHIIPYRMGEVVNFDPRLMIGWEAEVYNVEVDKGYQMADQIMDARLRNMCSAQLGGDTQRNLHVRSTKSQQTFKHIILPIWISSYTYNNKVYRFIINGQTGKVYGQKPTSWIKIVILVLLFVLFLAGIYYLKYSGLLAR